MTNPETDVGSTGRAGAARAGRYRSPGRGMR